MFREETAYEIEYGLVGSEVCIKDRIMAAPLEKPILDLRRHAAVMILQEHNGRSNCPRRHS